MSYSLVYLRPDGWWEAGNGWDTAADALADGKLHDWRGSDWRVVPTSSVVEIDGDRRLPAGVSDALTSEQAKARRERGA